MSNTDFIIEDDILTAYNGTETIVVIPECVKTIGANVFYGCRDIIKVVFPDSLETIEEAAFMNCASLSDIVFASGLIRIADHAFAGCSALTDLRIPEGVQYIEQSAFSPCSSLVSAELPDSLKILGEFAFSCCRRLKNITFSDELTQIEKSAFSMCSLLEQVTLPRSLKKLVRGVFLGCVNLREINAGPLLSSVENNAFSGCRSLKRINVDQDNPFIKDENGILYSRDGRTLLYFPGGLLEIRIPEDVTEIGAEAFYENNSFDRITLPSTLKHIGSSAFYKCTELVKIDFPDGLLSIGDSAFGGCTGLTDLYMPDSFREIGESAFRGCKNLMWIRLPQTVDFDVHWFCAPHDPPAFSADHTIIPFVSTRAFEDITSSIGTRRAALGYMMSEINGIGTDAVLGAGYVDYIRANASDYYDDMIDNADIARWMCRLRLIPEDDVEILLERAAAKGAAAVSAALLDYKSQNRPHIENVSSGQLEDRFSALENALDF